MSGRQQVQHLSNELALLTLANLTALISNTNIDASRDQGVRIKQLKVAATIKGLTAGEGPIVWGLALELTAVEIAECLLADPQAMQDTDAADKANRRVFPIGVFTMDTASDDPQGFREVGFPWKEIPEESTLKFYAWNTSGAALTTGAKITWNAAVVQEWLRD